MTAKYNMTQTEDQLIVLHEPYNSIIRITATVMSAPLITLWGIVFTNDYFGWQWVNACCRTKSNIIFKHIGGDVLNYWGDATHPIYIIITTLCHTFWFLSAYSIIIVYFLGKQVIFHSDVCKLLSLHSNEHIYCELKVEGLSWSCSCLYDSIWSANACIHNCKGHLRCGRIL